MKKVNPQSLTHLKEENRKFIPKDVIKKHSHIASTEEYDQFYQASIQNPDKFWLDKTDSFSWFTKPKIGCKFDWNSEAKKINHTWFEDGEINLSYNCLDRHLEIQGNKKALIWQGESDNESITLTYRELHAKVCKFANVLKAKGIHKGDRVAIYLPMVPEIAIAVLACARIGAIHLVIFAGFSAESIVHRVNDSKCQLLITSNIAMRGGKTIHLKDIVDEALQNCPSITNVIVVERTKHNCNFNIERDSWWHNEMNAVSSHCEPTILNAEDPLFILYTSGSTGKPKGVVHTQAGYLLHVSLTHKFIFDVHDDDIYWCTADLGWITGHSYGIYGPFANATTTVMFEGIPSFPDAGRFWQIIQKYKVTILYTAPTVIRSLMGMGDEYPKQYNLSSLRVLGTVGEPINPEAWMWYYSQIGHENCPIVDTWWQTETGGIMITALPGCHTLKPGSASRPFFGVDPVILRDDGTECQVNEGGSLCIRKPWPGIMRTTWGDHELFINNYFMTFPNMYFTGDSCRKDSEGDFWLLGRIDDVVNVSGHRIGTAEVESAFVSHLQVSEAAVVPIPHPIKGQGLYAFVTLKKGVIESPELKLHLLEHIRKEIGPIAIPDKIQFATQLPKTRSGKIMRRILRKIAENVLDNLGDLSTLNDPQIIESLIKDRIT